MNETNSTTANMATEPARLNLRRLLLLGTAGSDGNRRALLRSPGGQIQTVQVGDNLHRGTVVAIEDGRVVLVRRGQTEVLTIPEPVRARPAA